MTHGTVDGTAEKKSPQIRQLEDELYMIQLQNRIKKEEARAQRERKILVYSVSSFVLASLLFFWVFSSNNVEKNIAAGLGIVSGAFVTFLVLIADGVISKFKINGGAFANTKQIEDLGNKLSQVEKELIESNNELVGMKAQMTDYKNKLDSSEKKLMEYSGYLKQVAESNRYLKQQMESLDSKIDLTLAIVNKPERLVTSEPVRVDPSGHEKPFSQVASSVHNRSIVDDIIESKNIVDKTKRTQPSP